jgi:hypothetical protein
MTARSTDPDTLEGTSGLAIGTHKNLTRSW